MPMVSLFLPSFLCLFLVLIFQATPQSDLKVKLCFDNFGRSTPNSTYQTNPNSGRYTPNSTYETNLKILLSRLTSNAEIDYGFYNSSYGDYPDTAYASGLCRGDVKPEACRNCIKNSSVILPKQCPFLVQAVGVNDECILHYANVSVFGVQENLQYWIYWSNDTNSTNWDKYVIMLKDLLEKLKGVAASGDSLRKFAAGHVKDITSSQVIHAFVQCHPNLLEAQCRNCLERAFSNIQKFCDGKVGGRIIIPSCNFRFENYRFYDASVDKSIAASSPENTAPAPSPRLSPYTTFSHGKSKTLRKVIVIVIAIVAFTLLLIFICIYFNLLKRRKDIGVDVHNEIRTSESLQFDFETIRVATDDFSNENKLGQGGFGPVYKGRLSNGHEVAVKRLSESSGQGDIEFKNEVLLMAKLQHRNLVRLLGFCLERREKLLVYEFLPNKSLDYFIFDPTKNALLDWEKRHKIIVDIARGLQYLHEDSPYRIIHRDLKASNILLDAELNPKISDFGMARLFDTEQSQRNTVKIAGTYGYMAPEYARYGQFSVKSDVFSFGILLLEIVSGRKNICIRNGEHVEHLLSFAWENWRKGTAFNIIDPTLKSTTNEIMRCIQIGLLCVQQKVADRPIVASVVVMLESPSFSLPDPSQPAFFMKNRFLSDENTWEYGSETTKSSEHKSNSVQESVNELSITDLYPR